MAIGCWFEICSIYFNFSVWLCLFEFAPCPVCAGKEEGAQLVREDMNSLPAPSVLAKKKELNLYAKTWMDDKQAIALSKMLTGNETLTFLGFRECKKVCKSAVGRRFPVCGCCCYSRYTADRRFFSRGCSLQGEWVWRRLLLA